MIRIDRSLIVHGDRGSKFHTPFCSPPLEPRLLTVGGGGGRSVEGSALPGPHLSSHPSRILTANTIALVSRTRDMGRGWEPCIHTGSRVGTAWASPGGSRLALLRAHGSRSQTAEKQ